MTSEDLQKQVAELERLVQSGSAKERALTTARELLSQLPSDIKLDKTQVELRCRTLLALSTSLSQTGNTHDALKSAEEALSIAEQQANKRLQATANATIGGLHRDAANYAQSLDYFTRAVTLCEELGDKSQLATQVWRMGNVHRILADYPRALEYYTKARVLFEEIGDKHGLARVTTGFGLVHHFLEEDLRALEYLQQSLAFSEEVGDKLEAAANTGHIGSVYLSLSDFPRALEYLLKAFKMCEELEEKRGMAANAGAIGTVYAELHDYTQALEYYFRSLALFESLGDMSGVAVSMGNIGMVYAIDESQRSNLSSAEEYMLKALSLFEEMGMKKEQFEAHKNIADLFEKQKRWEKFAVHYKKFHELEKHVNSEEAHKRALHIEQEKQVALRESALAAERAIADATTALLHKVFPASVADRLIKGEKVADYFQEVSILFADIVGFTPIAAQMSASAVITFLNYVFSRFDIIIRKHGCEKIKTIGDGYMAVAGAPIECSDHAERIARAALELMSDIHLPEDIKRSLPANTLLHLRIGLHCGSVFGGIVGDERFVYDIYSDAVNLASRMESSGEAEKIHCSEEFMRHLHNRNSKDNAPPLFQFQERGEIEVKGKGVMRTYFLTRKDD